jgi:hypothetical protein
MRLLFLHVHVINEHIRALGRVFVDRLTGLAPGGGDLSRRKSSLIHLLTHRR